MTDNNGHNDDQIPPPLLKEADDLIAGIQEDRQQVEEAAGVIIRRALSLGQRIARLQLKHPRASYALTCRIADAVTKLAGNGLRPTLPAEEVDLYGVRDLFEQWMIELFNHSEVRVFVSLHMAAERAEMCGLLDPYFNTRKDLRRWLREVVAEGRIPELRESAHAGCKGIEWCHPDHKNDEVQFLLYDSHLKRAFARQYKSYPGADLRPKPAPAGEKP